MGSKAGLKSTFIPDTLHTQLRAILPLAVEARIDPRITLKGGLQAMIAAILWDWVSVHPLASFVAGADGQEGGADGQE